MKKFFIIIGIIFVILIGAVVAIPVIFKEDIKKAVDDVIAENLNANVYYDVDGFDLSLISNFPNLTLSMNDFGVSGKGVFSDDTLVNVSNFEFEIDIMSVINGGQIMINAITLNEPEIFVLVLPDGTANYDVTVPSDTTDTTEVVEEPEETSEATAFSMAIKKWEIKNADIIYFDQVTTVHAAIIGLNHSGSGDFTQDIFDLATLTTIDGLTVNFEGVDYLSNKTFSADLTLSMDLPNAKYTFKENFISLNDFGIGIDGYVAMPTDDIDMDINYSGKDITIKSILSLIPGVYGEYLEGIETNGNLEFSGYARGIFNDDRLPDVNASLDVKDGWFKYAEYPIPIEELNISTKLNVPGENMDDMTFEMPNFSMLMDGESVSANLSFSNLQNYTWAFGMDGNLDLEKLFKVVPLDSMDIKGKISAKLETSGNMALVEAEKYDEIPAEGNLGISDFSFSGADLPQGFSISSSEMIFTPKEVQLKNFDAMLGKSDMHMKGVLSNFIGFALDEKEILQGELDFYSATFDLDEWMTEEEGLEEVEIESDSIETEEVPLEVVRLPENINFKMMSKIDKILYDGMVIENLDGLITINEGIANLNKVDFDLLEGKFLMTGLYNSAVEKPLFDFTFNIDNLSIPKAYETFNTVKTIAPIAKNMVGNFSSDFALNGTLGGDMMPVYETMYGKGIIEIADAALEGDNVMKAIALASKSDNEKLEVKDLRLEVEIRDGRMYVDPFDVKVQGQTATVYGSNGIDGSLDYFMKLPVPTGAAGSAVNSFLSSYTGGTEIVSETIILKLNIAGTYDDPKVKIAGTETPSGQSPQQAAKDAALAELEKQKEIARKKAEAEIAKQRKIAEDKANAELDNQKKIAEEKAKKEAEELKKKAKNKLKGLF